MNTVSSFGFKRPTLQSIVMLTLGFWLSASLLLDWVIMPSLYVSGMITQASFATAGYVIFWNFNRIELLAAGLVLTCVLALNQTQSNWRSGSLILSILLLAISLTTTYWLTPEMSAIGMQLNLFDTTTKVPANMNLLHGGYWLLEVIKLVAGGTLLSWCWRQ
ncbi:DUF4149 domain-containing protein [Fischerella sp. NIES-3754]|uniref:DUF4149 domain-containing protein n=1 Tax=Fischerella sp. NIES-3754 TaxID=1752063 RepID=UPI000720C33F|nr:DUF4149 domain-containing protein [Fischerella sp. NIES-3754]BAU05408.1 hypothetical protein FIS3754_13030 [Fischerella sp. NIES-3754]BCX07669.1 MAG: hypothetical protein KatS3mg066_1528 [Fischerella sp.]